MTDDLIEQLRCHPANRLCRQVADALEAKDARIAELEAENEELKKAISKPWMGSARAALEKKNEGL